MDISNVEHGSNPPLSASKTAKSKPKRNTLTLPCQLTVPSLPHKRAKLIKGETRWYVDFHAWDESIQAVRRSRFFGDLNRKKYLENPLLREKLGEKMVRQINMELLEGKRLGVLEAQADTLKSTLKKYTLLQAIDYVTKQKAANNHRKQYVHNFNRLHTNLKKWMEGTGQPDFAVRLLRKEHVQAFLRWMQTDCHVGNKTYNNYLSDFSVTINFLMGEADGLLKKNPCEKIKKLPTVTTKHAAYSDEQMRLIINECPPTLALFIKFIYYTMSRPSTEVRFMKVHHIDIAEKRVFIPGENDKNKSDNYVGISDRFAQIILQSGVLNYPPHFYLFGKDGHPTETNPIAYATLQRWHADLLKKLGFDKLGRKYDLYSYKHSGVVSFYKATKDMKLLMQQLRHRSLDQTNIYLRDLGLHTDFEGLNKWQGAV
jgi:hypothetical protein